MLSNTSTNEPHRSFVRGSTVSSVQRVHTRIPGRARFKVASLYRSREVKRRLESRLSDFDGIETVQANVLTGSLLIVFDPKRSVEGIVRHIADTLAAGLDHSSDQCQRSGSRSAQRTLQQPIDFVGSAARTEGMAGSVINALEAAPSPAPDPSKGVGLPLRGPINRPQITERQSLHLITDALHFTAMPAVVLGTSPLVRLPIAFLRSFSLGLFHTSPILILLISLIALMGLSIGKKEGWSRSDALYFSFVTASTIGYGDLRPTKRSTKLLSIAIGLVGILLTGVVTSIGVHSAQKTFQNIA